MRTFLVATLMLTALLSTVPAEARPYPVECISGFYASSCTVDAVACDGTVTAAHDGSFHTVGAACVGGLACGVALHGTPSDAGCDLPASGPGYGCEPTPHGMRCDGDLVVCTFYSGAEASGVGYQGFDCGVLSCDFMTYQGRIKDRDCSVASTGASASSPVTVDCLPTTGFTTWCEVDVGVCSYKQTQYHLEGRTVTQLRCLGVVDCTWDSGSSAAARAAVDPSCPL